MKPLSFSLACLLTAASVFAQDAAPAKPAEAPAAPAPANAVEQAFTNLPAASRQEFAKHAAEANRLFNNKRIFEALQEIEQASKIFPDSGMLLNMRGACYVEFRDFAKARQAFQRALELAPGNPTIVFNLGEVAFVEHKWKEAQDLFNQALSTPQMADVNMRRLIEFKLLLCKLKLGQADEAKKLASLYEDAVDTPYYWYAQAAMQYHSNDTQGAEENLARATRIFRDPMVLAPWQDTLIEFGYIKNFYGGDLEEKSAPTEN